MSVMSAYAYRGQKPRRRNLVRQLRGLPIAPETAFSHSALPDNPHGTEISMKNVSCSLQHCISPLSRNQKVIVGSSGQHAEGIEALNSFLQHRKVAYLTVDDPEFLLNVSDPSAKAHIRKSLAD